MEENQTPKKKNKILPIIIVTLLGSLIIVALVVVGRVLKLQANAKELVAGVTEDSFRKTEASTIYDRKGEIISTLSGIKELYYLPDEEIPQMIKDSFVQIEDQDFYSHRGIDLMAIIRATIANVSSDSIKQGASTITQQLAKINFLSSEVTWNRKITEMFVAFELESKFTKDQILEFYVNNVYFANGYYGIEAAARGYFNKGAKDLSISEIAFLAGIPNNPNKYDPITHYDNAVTRRDSVLMQMYAGGIITSLEYYQAIEDKITISPSKEDHYNYIETYVFYCATRALMEANGFTIRYEFEDEIDRANYEALYDANYKEYQQSLFTGGYQIYTAIDMDKQELLQDFIDEHLKEFDTLNEEGIYQMQGAGVCIDNNSGLVTAIVGGRNQEYDGYTLNRAFQSYRQPGSSIKPVLDYAPYMEQGHNPEEIMDDTPFIGGPSNFDGKYRGLITLREALGWSANTIAWRIVEELTPASCMTYLHKMNFARIEMDTNIQSVSIGGFTYGATPVEMAAAYTTLENDGKYRAPTCVDHITDSKGDTIVAQRTPEDVTEVYTPNSARMVTKMMEWGVNEGLVTRAQLSNAIVAGKSGSTNDNKDGWFVGYSKYYTTAIWTGMDMPQSVPDLYGSTYPLSIWKDFMYEIHRGLPKLAFPDYEGELPLENETTPEEETKRPGHPNWQGGGVENKEDGDFNHDVDVSGMGDQDVNLGY